jgi:hypothetical protein
MRPTLDQPAAFTRKNKPASWPPLLLLPSAKSILKSKIAAVSLAIGGINILKSVVD